MGRFVPAVALLAAVLFVRLQAISSTARVEAKAREVLSDSVLRILILGDSVAAGAGDESGFGIRGRLAEQLSAIPIEVMNGGIPGARVRDVLIAIAERREQVQRSDVIVLSIGGNDLFGSSIERSLSLISPDYRMSLVGGRVQQVVERVQCVNPAARIIVLGLYNPYARSNLGSLLSQYVHRWDGKLMVRFAENLQVTVLPVADLLESAGRLSTGDGFHPGVVGYAAIATRIVGAPVFDPRVSD